MWEWVSDDAHLLVVIYIYTGLLDFLPVPLLPRSLAQVSDHFLHNFFSQCSSICTMQGRKSRAPSQRPITSPSRDPMRPDHATVMGAQR